MIWTAFILGLSGSLHCIGMCGPIALTLPTSGKKTSFYSGRLLYNFGRVSTYVFIGLIFGLLGAIISLVIYQQYISILAGMLLILWALSNSRLHLPGMEFTSKMFFWGNWVTGGLRKLIKKPGLASQYLFGVINGFLPCGLVYIAAISSLSGAGILYGIWYMLLFGAGTIPVMFILSISGKYISPGKRQKLNKLVPWIAAIIGILFILRGLGLGIPFISPDLQLIPEGVKSCCGTNN